LAKQYMDIMNSSIDKQLKKAQKSLNHDIFSNNEKLTNQTGLTDEKQPDDQSSDDSAEWTPVQQKQNNVPINGKSSYILSKRKKKKFSNLNPSFYMISAKNKKLQKIKDLQQQFQRQKSNIVSKNSNRIFKPD
ncbi:MAG: hypothetical protein MHPSP_002580, partial [Paramarteilia canceri]